MDNTADGVLAGNHHAVGIQVVPSSAILQPTGLLYIILIVVPLAALCDPAVLLSLGRLLDFAQPYAVICELVGHTANGDRAGDHYALGIQVVPSSAVLQPAGLHNAIDVVVPLTTFVYPAMLLGNFLVITNQALAVCHYVGIAGRDLFDHTTDGALVHDLVAGTSYSDLVALNIEVLGCCLQFLALGADSIPLCLGTLVQHVVDVHILIKCILIDEVHLGGDNHATHSSAASESAVNNTGNSGTQVQAYHIATQEGANIQVDKLVCVDVPQGRTRKGEAAQVDSICQEVDLGQVLTIHECAPANIVNIDRNGNRAQAAASEDLAIPQLHILAQGCALQGFTHVECLVTQEVEAVGHLDRLQATVSKCLILNVAQALADSNVLQRRIVECP